MSNPAWWSGFGGGATALWRSKKSATLWNKAGCEHRGDPVSPVPAREAESRHIPLGTLEEHPVIDLTIDGADEITPALDLIKGGGGELLGKKWCPGNEAEDFRGRRFETVRGPRRALPPPG